MCSWNLKGSCPPAEEGKSYEISAYWNTNPQHKSSVSWRRNRIPMGLCYDLTGCDNYFSDHYKLQIRRLSVNSMLSTLKIVNVSRKHEGLWSLSYVGLHNADLQDISTCNLQVYARGKLTACKYYLDETTIGIKCETDGVYPYGSCLLLGNDDFKYFGNVTNVVTRNNDKEGNIFYHVLCSFEVLLSHLMSNNCNAEAVITVYPNISNTDMDIEYGTRSLINFSRENETEVSCFRNVSLPERNTSVWYSGSSALPNINQSVLSFTTQAEKTGCDPAEEGAEYSFTTRKDKRDADISIRKESSMIGNCNAKNCTSYYKDMFNISYIEENLIKVTIFRVSRADAGVWNVGYIGFQSPLIPVCNIVTFVKPVNITCNLEHHGDGVNVTCSTQKIYPHATCRFQVYGDGKESFITNDEVSYEHNNFTDEKVFYVSNCTYGLRKGNFRFGKYEIRITVSPDIKTVHKNTKYASTVVVHFYTEKPLLKLKNCPTLATEETNITCECYAVNSTSTVDIRWYNKYGELLKKGNLLTFFANKSLAEYRCEGTDSIISVNQSLSYRPHILKEMKNIICTPQFTNENILVICSTPETYSRVSCVFNVTFYKSLLAEPEIVTIHHVSGQHHFHSTCTLKLSKSDFYKVGIFNVRILMYPNITQTNEDTEYGAISFLQFTTGDASLEEELSQAKQLQIISISVVAGFMIILITLSFICITVVKKRRRIHHRMELDKMSSLPRMLNTYKNDHLEDKGHVYESVKEEDRYDVCGNYNELDRYKPYDSESYERPIHNDGNSQVCIDQEFLDTEYITPIELDIILGKQT
ncbi:hypothetical protein Btru_009303 [Bulinus truncatus]|nr:hypothetical protein Btru_009303 [Bulinus truncatus]